MIQVLLLFLKVMLGYTVIGIVLMPVLFAHVARDNDELPTVFIPTLITFAWPIYVWSYWIARK